MNRCTIKRGSADHAALSGFSRLPSELLVQRGRLAVACFNLDSTTINWPGDIADVCLANPRSCFHKRRQNGLEIKGRAADDLEHFGGRGLLRQRFAQLVE